MKKTITLGHFILAGIPYAIPHREPWEQLSQNQPVRVVRERHNPHDPLAIQVATTDGFPLGYIRRDDNRILSAIMDQQGELAAHIAKLDTECPSHPREVHIAISILV